jgi:hypothetical protein
MPVRSTMSDLISRVAMMIGDPNNVQFPQQTVQDYLDANRDDIRYEQQIIAPSIVNAASTGNQAQTIFADYYSRFPWWEQDITLQAYYNGAAWVVVTPVQSDYITGHWQFETNVFQSGTAPGQLPPVFATGKVYDLYAAAADLLEYWAATSTASYDISVDGQSLRRSQILVAKLKLAQTYRMHAKMKTATMNRTDVLAPVSSDRMRLLDSPDTVKGW